MNNIFKNINTRIIISVYLLIVFSVIYYFFLYNNVEGNVEGFTPYLRGIYRPHIRNIRLKYNNILDLYGPEFIITKLKRWNLY